MVASGLLRSISSVSLPMALTPETGGYALELQALYLIGGLVVALLGAGRFSLGGGRLN